LGNGDELVDISIAYVTMYHIGVIDKGIMPRMINKSCMIDLMCHGVLPIDMP